MSVEIVLVRHGQSEGNRDRVFVGHGLSGLTPLGRRQAEATAQALASTAGGIQQIYTSDLPRAVATAEPLARLTGLGLVHEPAIRERDVGALSGLGFEEVKARFPDGWRELLARSPDFRPEGGESHRDCAARVGAFLDGLWPRHTAGRVVLVSHGVAINHMLRHLIGLAPDGPRNFFMVDNCSIHRLQRGDDGALRIVAINEIAHLAGIVADETIE